ncbi:SH3 domain-binding protein 5 homolog [Venturia canescens]|uniref:SH3 domain-binding protein 5 homolog n=1 Tax=Venturia canescens TaxID=32260 RepID=UPI001C9C4988|nr:SH3 domain-binding protein 5 homolog [Venturia canescens]
MDVVDDAEGPLDPRIQIELENLNTATDNINKLEIELDEARTALEQLWSESTRRSKDISNKLGASCIDRARCYYKAREVARQAQVQCQYQAQLFQRASEIHAAAKETVALAEARFLAHQHEWNFDQAWQDMLNHATIKVMDAENQKAECGREHHRRTALFHDADMKVQQLEEKYRRSIIKAEPYFEMKAQYDQMLATQKECVKRLEKAVKEAKRSYSASFRALEDISNQIHQQRRDYDMVANGPREPGVGAELVSPEDSLNYETELNKVSISRVNSLASSSDPDAEDRNKDFDDIRDLQQRVDQLGGRSIDGSESFSSQWELELQASMEKLNSLSMKNSQWNVSSAGKDESDSAQDRCNVREKELSDHRVRHTEQVEPKSLKNDQNEQKKLPIDFQILRKLTSNSTITSSSGDVRQSLTQSPINSILNRSKMAIRNGISKSLSNSSVNMSFGFARSRIENQTCDTKKPPKDGITNEKCESRIPTNGTTEEKDSQFSETSKNVRIEEEKNLGVLRHSEEFRESELPKSSKSVECDDPKNRKLTNDKLEAKKLTQFTSHSVDSTPVRSKPPLSRTTARSLDHDNEDLVKCPNFKKIPAAKTSSVRELPLLSLFEKTAKSPMSKDKSCSMINLAEKHNLKTLLDNPDLRSIQTVSVERLASARNNLINEHSEASKAARK